MNNKNNNFLSNGVCLVGIGRHMLSKIIPALNNLEIPINGYVSSRKSLRKYNIVHFSSIKEALTKTPKSSVFIIASPPENHFEQVETIANAGFDMFIEKPAFLTYKHAKCINEIINSNNNILCIELMVYLENITFKKIFNNFFSHVKEIKSIQTNFLIPNIPIGSFRDPSKFETSLLADMSCYPISYLSMFNISLDDIHIINRRTKEFKSEKYEFGGKLNHIDVNCIVGKDNVYKNNLNIEFIDGKNIFCEPFYYGREGIRLIKHIDKNKKILKEIKITEINCFESIFNHTRDYWLSIQNQRAKKLVSSSLVLERLGIEAFSN